MPVTTRSGANPPPDGKVMLEHAVTVLKQAKDGPLAKALAHANIEDIVDLLALSPPERDALVFPLADGTEKPLSLGHKSMLRALKIFTNFCQADGNPIEDWTVVTKKDFDNFRTSQTGLATTEKMDALSLPTPAPHPKQKDLLSEFKKGIKRDASLFVVLKDLKQWDSWHCSTVAQAWVQDVSDVLDLLFKPVPAEKDLFEAKQKYMYAVFERVLQTDRQSPDEVQWGRC